MLICGECGNLNKISSGTKIFYFKIVELIDILLFTFRDFKLKIQKIEKNSNFLNEAKAFETVSFVLYISSKRHNI